DDFVIKVANNSGNKHAPRDFVKKLGDALPAEMRIRRTEEEQKHKHNHPADCPCCHGEFDPHVWLGIEQAMFMVNTICKALQDKAPAHSDAFRKRADAFLDELRDLQEYGKKAFEGKENLTFITNHDSFRYFAKSFGLKCVGIIQAQPGVEVDSV